VTGKCSNVTLSKYFDGELDEAERRAVEAHLASCARCSRSLASLRRMSDALKALPDPTPPDRLWSHLCERLDRTRPSQLARTWRVGRRAMVAATVLVLLACAGYWYSHRLREETFTWYLQAFAVSPDAAQLALQQRYETKPISLEQVHWQGRRPVAATAQLPAGLRVQAVYLVKMPCCTCVETVCRDERGRVVVFFEHASPHCGCLGREGILCRCHGKEVQIVDTGSYLAASWTVQGRAITAVGVEDLAELVSIVSQLSES